MGRKSREKWEKRAEKAEELERTLGDGPWLPEADQRRIVHAVLRACRTTVPEHDLHHRMCGIYTMTLWHYLYTYVHQGYRPVFGYVRYGTGDPQSHEVAGVHPSNILDRDGQGEIYHAWVVRQHQGDRVEMIDVTLGFWPAMAEAVGFSWQRPAFPSYLWTWADEVRFGEPWDADYTPSKGVTQRMLEHFTAPDCVQDLKHWSQVVEQLVTNPDMVLFGVAGRVPAENPWGPMEVLT